VLSIVPTDYNNNIEPKGKKLSLLQAPPLSSIKMFIGTTPKSIAITISGISGALFNNLV